LEIDRSGKTQRIVIRDLQDSAVDAVSQKAKNMPVAFARHYINDVEHIPMYDGKKEIDSKKLSTV